MGTGWWGADDFSFDHKYFAGKYLGEDDAGQWSSGERGPKQKACCPRPVQSTKLQLACCVINAQLGVYPSDTVAAGSGGGALDLLGVGACRNTAYRR